MLDVVEELWAEIEEFPNYHISDLGRIFNIHRESYMRPSFNPLGHLKITLKSPWDSSRHCRSVSRLVAEAFVESPDVGCDHVVLLDGNFSNVAAYNLVWRPRWLTWKYTHQLRTRQPTHYHNLPCINVVTGVMYNNIIEAGMTEGLVFEDIWRSTYTGIELYPYGSIFEIVK